MKRVVGLARCVYLLKLASLLRKTLRPLADALAIATMMRIAPRHGNWQVSDSAHGILLNVSALDARFAAQWAEIRRLGGQDTNIGRSEEMSDASKCKTQLGVGPDADGSGNCGGSRMCLSRNESAPRKVFCFGSAAEQDAKAHSVRHRAQHSLAGLQAMACVVESALARMQQTEVAKKLTFRAPIAQVACDDQRRLKVIASLVELGQAVVNHSEVA